MFICKKTTGEIVRNFEKAVGFYSFSGYWYKKQALCRNRRPQRLLAI
jgi:hypothetical protein